MIDNLAIMLEGFSGTFENCQLVKSREAFDTYLLKGRSHIAPHPLKLLYAKKTGKLYIKNSLRKWYHGKISMLDLTSKTLIMALKHLAASLNISYEELGQGRITQLEIGLTLWTKIPCRRLVRLLAGYKNKERFSIAGETVYFGKKKRPDKKIMIYDKGAEMVNRMSLKNLRTRHRIADMFDILASHGYYFPRYEFKLADYNALSSNQLDIRSVADLIVHYSKLYLFLAREARNFVLFERINITNDMTPKEREIAEGLNKYEYNNFLEKRQTACRSSTSNGLKTARCKVRRELVSVIDRFRSGDYGSRQFRIDLGRNFVRVSKHDPELNLPETFRELFGRPIRRSPYNK